MRTGIWSGDTGRAIPWADTIPTARRKDARNWSFLLPPVVFRAGGVWANPSSASGECAGGECDRRRRLGGRSSGSESDEVRVAEENRTAAESRSGAALAACSGAAFGISSSGTTSYGRKKESCLSLEFRTCGKRRSGRFWKPPERCRHTGTASASARLRMADRTKHRN